MFSQGGYCFFKSTAAVVKNELVFDVGPLGLWPNAAHGHADALHVMIRLNGRFLLTDSGTGTYYSSQTTRDALRGTAAHNTVTIDGLDQADTYDIFKWINPMNVRLLDAFVGDHFDYAHAMHDGYHRLRRPVTHHRTVLAVRPATWLLIDHLTGDGEHEVTRHFHFPPGSHIERESGHDVVAMDTPTGLGLHFTFAERIDAAASTWCCNTDGLWSERYGQVDPSPHMACTTVAQVPLTLCTVIRPIAATADRRAPSWVESRPLAGGGAVVGFGSETAGGTEKFVLINPQGHDVEVATDVRSNALFLFLDRLGKGQVERAFLTGEGRYCTAGEWRLQCDAGQSFQSFVQFGGDGKPARDT